jgi:hypothetical protein
VITTVALVGCGETYVDESLIDPTTAPDPTMTAAAGADGADPDAGDLATALTRIDDALDRLSDAVADDPELAGQLLAAIDSAWAAVEDDVRAEHPDQLFGMQQAIDLAHSAVTRKRPADASKAWKILRDIAPTLG